MSTGSPGLARVPTGELYSVSRLNREVKGLLEASWPDIWIEGEISNLARPASGHVYFSLKDDAAQVRCAMFRGSLRGLARQPAEGMQVLLRARVSLFEARGDFQLIVQYLEESGEGALRRAFEALKQRLAAEGLFEARHKRPLPALPRRIGIITSPTGAAVRDVVTTLRRRFPAIPLLLYPVPVQGEGAAARIAEAFATAARRAECDVLILARGGGSLEDLWSFNEEIVARAIHECPVPVVTGVGHETDFTIADLAADQRAPTPTGAAELVVPNAADWLAGVERHRRQLGRLVAERLRDAGQRLDHACARLAHPRRRLAAAAERLDGLQRRLRHAESTTRQGCELRLTRAHGRLHRLSPLSRLRALADSRRALRRRLGQAMGAACASRASRVDGLHGRLRSVSPRATLERGYAVLLARDDGSVLRDAARVGPGTRVEALLARGRLDLVVEAAHGEDGGGEG